MRQSGCAVPFGGATLSVMRLACECGSVDPRDGGAHHFMFVKRWFCRQRLEWRQPLCGQEDCPALEVAVRDGHADRTVPRNCRGAVLLRPARRARVAGRRLALLFAGAPSGPVPIEGRSRRKQHPRDSECPGDPAAAEDRHDEPDDGEEDRHG